MHNKEVIKLEDGMDEKKNKNKKQKQKQRNLEPCGIVSSGPWMSHPSLQLKSYLEFETCKEIQDFDLLTFVMRLCCSSKQFAKRSQL